MQLSMDGCNVNWKFYYNLFQECKGEELPDLLNIFSSSSDIYWSCSLHVVHGRCEKGAKGSGWNFGNTLRSLWQIFYDTPARKENFIQISSNELFPFRFCQHRWVEDIEDAEQALKIWPYVNK